MLHILNYHTLKGMANQRGGKREEGGKIFENSIHNTYHRHIVDRKRKELRHRKCSSSQSGITLVQKFTHKIVLLAQNWLLCVNFLL